MWFYFLLVDLSCFTPMLRGGIFFIPTPTQANILYSLSVLTSTENGRVVRKHCLSDDVNSRFRSAYCTCGSGSDKHKIDLSSSVQCGNVPISLFHISQMWIRRSIGLVNAIQVLSRKQLHLQHSPWRMLALVRRIARG